MTRLAKLTALYDAAKEGTATIVEIEALAIAAFPDDAESRDPIFMHVWSICRGSTDAALAFHNAVLPGWAAQVDTFGNASVWRSGDIPDVIDRKDLWKWVASHEEHIEGKPALALFLADMAALIEMETAP